MVMVRVFSRFMKLGIKKWLYGFVLDVGFFYLESWCAYCIAN